MNKDEKAENSTVYVTRTIGTKGNVSSSTEAEDIIAVHRFATEPAKVMVDYALTINLGNFESMRHEVSAEASVEGEDADEVRQKLAVWVRAQVNKSVREAREAVMQAKADKPT